MVPFKHLSISKRLILNFGLAALFTSVASAIAIFTFIDSKNSLEKLDNQQIFQLKIANAIALNTHEISAKSRALILSLIHI